MSSEAAEVPVRDGLVAIDRSQPRSRSRADAGEAQPPTMTHDEAIQVLLNDPAWAQNVLDNYHDDVATAAPRFLASAEFNAVLALLKNVRGSVVLDVGAGNGMASFAFARSGAARVYAVEPDDSPLVGRQAIRRITDGLPVEVIGGVGEALPLPDASVDIAYCRATLHHVEDLGGFATECARVLRPGGVFLACREPVVRDARELHRFLGDHRVHQLAGGEHAYYLDEYVGALTGAGLAMQRVFGPWDTIINAFPAFDSDEALRDVVGAKLRKKLGPLGGLAAPLRILDPLFLLWIRRPRPGRSFSFFARKP